MPVRFLATPWIAGGLLLALILSHGCAYLRGRGDGSASIQARYAAATERALAAMRLGEAAIQHLNGRYAASLAAQHLENRSISHAAQPLLPRPVYSTICVDADGVGLLDRARANSNLALDPREPAGAAP
jgi:hypothetical protein